MWFEERGASPAQSPSLDLSVRQNEIVSDQGSTTTNTRTGEKAVPPAPMPRDKQGWRVAPAPDGRGMPEEHKPSPPHRWRGLWIFFIGLLALNWLSVLVFQPSTQARVKVPFSPYFLNQLEAGKVASISSTSGAINGTRPRR